MSRTTAICLRNQEHEWQQRGRNCLFVTIGCGRSTPKLPRPFAGLREQLLPPSRLFSAAPANVKFQGRIQRVDATVRLNISAGVWKPSVFLGLSFNWLANRLSFACE